jgi:pimeloyl-ACP methyl ester carboxylesterase
VTTFALVHGAWHGGWCWERVAARLEARGHTVVAPDLPCEDPEAGAGRYADVVCEALEGAGDDVVAVGHSSGGLTIPVVATRRPIRRLVFLAAFIPEVGRSLNQQLAGMHAFHDDFRRLRVHQDIHPDGSSSWPERVAIEAYYYDCTPADARWAVTRMRRQAQLPFQEVTPLEAWPEDRTLRPEWCREEARRRLGVEPVDIPGGHCSFLLEPTALLELLDP